VAKKEAKSALDHGPADESRDDELQLDGVDSILAKGGLHLKFIAGYRFSC
jgi:hypothetical protein